MKNLSIISILITVMLIFSACPSAPPPVPVVEEAPPPPPPVPVVEEPEITSIEPETPIEQEFKDTYDRHRSNIILDGSTSYTVRRGDTLVRIAQREYHDGAYYPLIMLASSDVVLDPDRIAPNMRLTVPNLKTNLEDETAREALRNFLLEIAVIEERRGRSGTAKMLRDRAK